MAHPCPDCGVRCHCGGDIDDCEFENTTEQQRCTHCTEDQYPADDLDDDDQDVTDDDYDGEDEDLDGAF